MVNAFSVKANFIFMPAFMPEIIVHVERFFVGLSLGCIEQPKPSKGGGESALESLWLGVFLKNISQAVFTLNRGGNIADFYHAMKNVVRML